MSRRISKDSNTVMKLLILRAGVMMYPRSGLQKQERVRHDHKVLALSTTCPGGVDGWSFLRGKGRGVREFWYVLAQDVDPENDLQELRY